jgi:histone acetyltransferase (RNA polymerase elongator complex component)
MYLHRDTGKEYFAHILAEEKRRNVSRKIEEWVQVKPDNHLLDCEVIAAAVADPECPGGGVQLINAPMICSGASAAGGQKQTPRQPVTIRSKWMGGR